MKDQLDISRYSGNAAHHAAANDKAKGPLDAAAGSPAFARTGASLTRDELRVIEDLAFMVLNSKQNVGTRMKDHADSVRRIMAGKKQGNVKDHATDGA